LKKLIALFVQFKKMNNISGAQTISDQTLQSFPIIICNLHWSGTQNEQQERVHAYCSDFPFENGDTGRDKSCNHNDYENGEKDYSGVQIC
jgi:hypothetical protein